MSEISTGSRSPITFSQSLPIEVTPAPFVQLESIRHLDLGALSEETHAEIEVGYFDTGCRQMVLAVVEDGIVTEVKIEPCPESKMEPAPPEMRTMLQTAFRRVRSRGKRFQPMPVSRFFASQGGTSNLTIDSITCVRICIWGFCFVCCTTINPDTPFWCGDRVIIVRDPVPSNP